MAAGDRPLGAGRALSWLLTAALLRLTPAISATPQVSVAASTMDGGRIIGLQGSFIGMASDVNAEVTDEKKVLGGTMKILLTGAEDLSKPSKEAALEKRKAVAAAMGQEAAAGMTSTEEAHKQAAETSRRGKKSLEAIEMSQKVSSLPAEEALRTPSARVGVAQQAEAAVDVNEGSGSALEGGYGGYFWRCVISWVIWIVLAFLVVQGCYVRGLIPEKDPRSTADPVTRLKSGHFDCFSDFSVCLCSVICLPIRWADTVSMANLLSFWKAFAIFAVAGLLNHVIFIGVYTWGVLTAGVMFFYRQQLRKKLFLNAWRYDVALLDCLYVLFCPFCAVAQEAMVVREAYETGHEGFEGSV
jgi:Cys-rich protein (TIGR01571 family)